MASLLIDPERLLQRAREARELASPCRLCPRRCGAERLAGRVGVCGASLALSVAAVSVHRGEEPCIAGSRGAGNVFFSHCNLTCRFCQNWPISQLGHGREHTPEELAGMLLSLQRRGAHNVNLVTATPQLPGLLEALAIARQKGLTLPLVWNSNGYESVEALRLLDGVVDVWLPDLKYADDAVALRLSGAPGYVEAAHAAILEMARQAPGGIELDADGLARRGLLIRHLVLPGRLSGTAEVLGWIAATLGRRAWVSLMCQYFPAGPLLQDREPEALLRRLDEAEWEEALAALEASGLEEGYVQDPEAEGGC